MLTSSSIEPEMNGFGRYCAVTRELFHVKTTCFRQLHAHKRVPFHLGVHVHVEAEAVDKAIFTTCTSKRMTPHKLLFQILHVVPS